ncbi:MAG: MFS transporter [Phenylobacterium sp.]|jgi:DHA1 family tetracycline resistance protein-like MFS transporter|uniref:MFS transporter n=1 Tax=Phenylobacterium sp. TaxID=1871053 RepID=UPI001B68273C|nr:MFS transporter [Phenylobacterium sp.]MBP7651023.1 MFS transporter [Phenylobacterium sp.]MBP7817158.1 MFS transporter [Phenylobacterium sp.]MBP9230568.1 MFS transporter [Phenylobacterium sp.]
MSESEPYKAPAPRFAAASLIAVIFINMLGFGIIVPLLPFYAKSFDAAPWQIGLIFGAYSVGAFFGEPLWGRLSDKYGRKPLLISTIMGNCLCYLALAFAPNIWVAFAIRLVGGLAAGNGAVVQGYIADVTPPEKRARQMSYQGAAWNVGLIIGPSVGGFFAHEGMGPAGFRIPLFIASGLAALCVIAIAIVIKESRVREEGISHRPSRWSAIGEAVGHPVIGRMMLLTFLVGFAFTGIESQFGLWSQARFGWGPRDIAVCFAFTGATAFFFQTLVTGRMSEKYGEGVMLAVGMGMTAVAAALQIFSINGTMTIALMCLTAAGQSVAFPNVGAIISRTADPHRQGQIMGLNNATGALARVTGPICAGLMVPLMRDGPFILGALVVTPAILLALSATRRAIALGKLNEPTP